MDPGAIKMLVVPGGFDPLLEMGVTKESLNITCSDVDSMDHLQVTIPFIQLTKEGDRGYNK